MVKGAQKQMIVIRTGNSRYFDEAYFVLRREVRPQRGRKNDILEEANRILEEHDPPHAQSRKKRLSRGALLFLLGILCGAAVAALICLISM